MFWQTKLVWWALAYFDTLKQKLYKIEKKKKSELPSAQFHICKYKMHLNVYSTQDICTYNFADVLRREHKKLLSFDERKKFKYRAFENHGIVHDEQEESSG